MKQAANKKNRPNQHRIAESGKVAILAVKDLAMTALVAIEKAAPKALSSPIIIVRTHFPLCISLFPDSISNVVRLKLFPLSCQYV